MESCQHNYVVCGYNSAIVIEECTKCGDEMETSFDWFCSEYGFPVIEDD